MLVCLEAATPSASPPMLVCLEAAPPSASAPMLVCREAAPPSAFAPATPTACMPVASAALAAKLASPPASGVAVRMARSAAAAAAPGCSCSMAVFPGAAATPGRARRASPYPAAMSALRAADPPCSEPLPEEALQGSYSWPASSICVLRLRLAAAATLGASCGGCAIKGSVERGVWSVCVGGSAATAYMCPAECKRGRCRVWGRTTNTMGQRTCHHRSTSPQLGA
eukprot:137745-Chlamydomonas_euryale.AAC.1